MRKYLAFGISCFAIALFLTGVAKDDEAKRVGDAYTLDTCPVSGEKLGSMGETPILLHEGREVRLCCEGCVKKYQANAEAMNQEIDKKLIADQESHYPTNTCINSGAELKDGGVSFIVGNRLMKTCCTKCEAKVKADPAAYLAKLDEQVIEAQKADYKLDVCPISGEKIEEGAPQIVVANRLVKLCCEGCKKGAEKDPAGLIEKIDAAAK